jgi:ribosomal protein S18 acetylase RimI-like enzyme
MPGRSWRTCERIVATELLVGAQALDLRLESYELVPRCADAGFDHRSCNYWEDADHGSKAARASWLERGPAPAPAATRPAAHNPFALDDDGDGVPNPFASARGPARNPFRDDDDADEAPNPFAPRPAARPTVAGDAPPKLRLLARGLVVFGSYAKVLLEDEVPAVYAQFGPLSAYPRALRTRELYPRLPDAPLPAVITCIATTAAARDRGLAAILVETILEDLAARGFSAVETYPEVGARENATSAATPAFWEHLGFAVAAPDERFPVMRRELG